MTLPLHAARASRLLPAMLAPAFAPAAHAVTDRAAVRLFPGLAGSRVEAALQASF